MSQQPDYILRLPDVMKLTGLSRSTIYEMVKVGSFPKQTRLGKRAVGWRCSAISGWIETQPQA